MSEAPARRRALLLGVPRQDSDYITSLPVVQNDLECVADALRSSRYQVEMNELSNEIDFTSNRLSRRIRRFCEAEESVGATLLLYFSGHGLHWRGKNWLVAGDAYPENLRELERGLVDADQSEVFNNCKARTIVFMIDACREGVNMPEKAVLEPWSDEQVRVVNDQRRALVFSCGKGEYSRFYLPGDGQPGYSIFSRALADVMTDGHDARTLREVVAALKDNVERLCARHGLSSQNVRPATEGDAHDPVWDEEISDSATLRAGPAASDAWVRAVRDSALWKPGDDAQATALRESAARIAVECARQRDAVGAGGWADPDWAVRVLARAEFLVKQSSPALALSLAETWLLVTAPFVAQAVREASVAALGAPADRPATEVERVHHAMPQLARKAQRLRETGRAAEAASVEAWLLRRAARNSSRAWTPEDDRPVGDGPAAGDRGLLPLALWKALAPEAATFELAPDEWRTRLVALARLVDADPGWREREDLPPFFRRDEMLAPGSGHEQTMRASLLGWILALSSRMAIDVMTLGDVVVDHVGLADPVAAEQAVDHCRRLRWIPHGDGRSARLECEHPAIDMAVREAIALTNLLLDRVHLQRAHHLDALAGSAGWPRALHDDDVQPATRDGKPSYQTPHVSFQLAHHEVRELLMGQQLYGDPNLAIRELYQNALDACRYLDARLQYQVRTGAGGLSPWRGAIRFNQYRDASGRPVLECLDNGIGMGRRELEKAFAAVGKRFADMPEFIDEKATWQRLDPPILLYPNSRFGIGVLSYFMLADELEIFTRRVGLDGRAQGPALHVTVSGSGSLFRIREAGADSPVQQGGTLVRLFMNRTRWTDSEKSWLADREISCVRTLSELLYRSDYAVSAQHAGMAPVEWAAGQLRREAGRDAAYYQPALPDETWVDGAGGLPVWWHHSDPYATEGLVLSDGVATETKLFGRTIDLRETNRPRLTVDRRKVIELDKALVSRLSVAAVAALAPPPAWLDMKWLWKFAASEPAAAQALADALRQDGSALPLAAAQEPPVRVRLADIGLTTRDETIVDFLMATGPDGLARDKDNLLKCLPEWLLPWRIAMWHTLGLAMAPQRWLPATLAEPVAPFVLTDADVSLLRVQSPYEYLVNWYSKVTIRDLVACASRLGQTIESVHASFSRWSAKGLVVASPPADLLALRPDAAIAPLLLAHENTVLADGNLVLDARRLAILCSGVGISLAAARDALLPVAPALGFELPELPADVAPLVFDAVDRRLLSIGLEGNFPWVDAPLSTDHVIKAATKIGIPLREVMRRLERMRSLDVVAPAVSGPALDTPATVPILEFMPLDGATLGLAGLLRAAAGLSWPLSQTLAAATRWGWTADAEAARVVARQPAHVPDPLLTALLKQDSLAEPRTSTCAELAATWFTPGSLPLAHAARAAPAEPAVQQARVASLAALLDCATPHPAWAALSDADKLPEQLFEALAHRIPGDRPGQLTEVAAWRIAVISGGVERSLAQTHADLSAALVPWGTWIEPLPEVDAALLEEVRKFVPPAFWLEGPDAQGAIAYNPRVDARRIDAIAKEFRMSVDAVLQEAHRWRPFGVVVVEDAPAPA